MRVASAIELDQARREELVKLAHSNTAEVRLARRAGIILLAADGLDNRTIAELMGDDRISAYRMSKIGSHQRFPASSKVDIRPLTIREAQERGARASVRSSLHSALINCAAIATLTIRTP